METASNLHATQELSAFLNAEKISNRENAKLARLTTMGIGGASPILIEPDSEGQLSKLVSFLVANSIAYKILGAGSNLVINDQGISEPVIKLGRAFRFEEDLDSKTLKIGGAMPLMPLARKVSDRGLSGIEFAGGIPASIGGAARMNAGAHGGEFSDVLKRITFVDPEGKLQTVNASELEFSYRKSSIPQGAVVTQVEFEFVVSEPEKVQSKMAECLAQRKAAQPLSSPSAGSVFKNPAPDNTAGMLLDRCGMKGYQIGGAKVSEKHANWIVNESRTGTLTEVEALIAKCQETAKEQEGVELHPELILWK